MCQGLPWWRRLLLGLCHHEGSVYTLTVAVAHAIEVASSGQVQGMLVLTQDGDQSACVEVW